MMDPFTPKLYSSIQNNIDLNVEDGLNFVMCEQAFNFLYLSVLTCREDQDSFAVPTPMMSSKKQGIHVTQ